MLRQEASMDRGKCVENLLDRARRGLLPTGVWLSTPSPVILEIVGKFKFDWVLINLEHTTISGKHELYELIRVADLIGLPAIVKLAKRDPYEARDALDAGAIGIQVPFVDTAQQLREILDACRFPPHGSRGFCSITRASGYGAFSYTNDTKENEDFVRFGNEQALVIPMIESVEATNNLDEIMAVPGCHIFGIGTEDLMMDLEAFHEPAGYHLQMTASVGKKLHAGGKLVMNASSAPLHTLERDDIARMLNYTHNDIPYILDVGCLMYGLVEVGQVMERARAQAAEAAAARKTAAR
jgi:2-keto-3-deoxy-L-rhamnonate aldolase RhmA